MYVYAYTHIIYVAFAGREHNLSMDIKVGRKKWNENPKVAGG